MKELSENILVKRKKKLSKNICDKRKTIMLSKIKQFLDFPTRLIWAFINNMEIINTYMLLGCSQCCAFSAACSGWGCLKCSSGGFVAARWTERRRGGEVDHPEPLSV